MAFLLAFIVPAVQNSMTLQSPTGPGGSINFIGLGVVPIESSRIANAPSSDSFLVAREPAGRPAQVHSMSFVSSAANAMAPKLYQALRSHQQISKVVLTLPSGRTFTMLSVYVTSINTHNGVLNARPTQIEDVTLTFNSISSP